MRQPLPDICHHSLAGEQEPRTRGVDGVVCELYPVVRTSGHGRRDHLRRARFAGTLVHILVLPLGSTLGSSSSDLRRAYSPPLAGAGRTGGHSWPARGTKGALRIGGGVSFSDGLRRRCSDSGGLDHRDLSGTSLRTLTLIPYLGFVDSDLRPRRLRSRNRACWGVAEVGWGLGHLGQSSLRAFRSHRLRASCSLRGVASVVGGSGLGAGGVRALPCGGTRRPTLAGVKGS